MINKLSFVTKKSWNGQKSKLITKIDGKNEWTPGLTVVILGNIPYPPEYDKEGNIIKPAGHYKDWAVDVAGDLPPSLDKYLIPEKKHYYNDFPGRYDIKTKT